MTTHDPVHFGFKQITQDNWLRAHLTNFFPEITTGLWLGEVLKPRLAPKVPEEVQALFECARGLVVYGYLFYPLSTVAAVIMDCIPLDRFDLPDKQTIAVKIPPTDNQAPRLDFLCAAHSHDRAHVPAPNQLRALSAFHSGHKAHSQISCCLSKLR